LYERRPRLESLVVVVARVPAVSLTAKLIALGVLALALAAGFWKLWHSADRAGYQRSQAEYQAAAELQREGNRGRVYEAEKKEAAQTVYRDRYITRIVKEIDHAAQDLASCPVPPAVGRLLNDAAQCAREDRPAACGAGDGLPKARRHARGRDGERPGALDDGVDRRLRVRALQARSADRSLAALIRRAASHSTAT